MAKQPDYRSLAMMMSLAAANNGIAISPIVGRLGKLVKRLKKYELLSTSAIIGGLLTEIGNHPSTLRLEVLAHLVAMHCRGTHKAEAQIVRKWLNEDLFNDPVRNQEDPVEDVFISNVPTWFGNARLFEGTLHRNDFYLRSCLAALNDFSKEDWARSAQLRISALLKLSEEVAKRTKQNRFVMSKGEHQKPLRITSDLIESSAARVHFTKEDLDRLKIPLAVASQFFLTPEYASKLGTESLGHSTLERYPFVPGHDSFVVILPTAIGACARRFLLEAVTTAGLMEKYEIELARHQFSTLLHIGFPGWEIKPISMPREDFKTRLIEVVGTFDDGAYAHIIYTLGSGAEVLREGLAGLASLATDLDDIVLSRATDLAARSDYRRGLTIVICGGFGLGFSVSFDYAPPNWEGVAMDLSDFMLLAWDHDANALRTWKLLSNWNDLMDRGVGFVNLSGFLNLYAYADAFGFELVPKNSAGGLIQIASNFLAGFREKVRQNFDEHVAISPNEKRWVEVHRKGTAAFFKEAQNQPIYVSPADALQDVLLGCVETAMRSWWVRYSPAGSSASSTNLESRIWEMALDWLKRLAPKLEQNIDQSSRPVTFDLIFPNAIEHESLSLLAKPSVSVEGRIVTIACGSDYLASFSSPTNVGDKEMIRAMITGGLGVFDVKVPDEEVGLIIEEIVKSDKARFVHTLPAVDPPERIHAAVPSPRPRFITLEDSAVSHANLARLAGYTGPAGVIADKDALFLLHEAVDTCWKRIRSRLLALDRASIVQRGLENFSAIERDRMQWRTTAAALLSLYNDQADVVEAFSFREAQRASAGVASRVMVEMALCTSPVSSGQPSTHADLDSLLADIGTLIQVANQRDAIFYELTNGKLEVNANGTFEFAHHFLEGIHQPYMQDHSARSFAAAASRYDSLFSKGTTNNDLPFWSLFDDAWRSEFFLTLFDLYAISMDLSDIAIEKGTPCFRLSHKEVLDVFATRLQDTEKSERAILSLSLRPREKWDEPKPQNAKARDWYPWKFNRKLSLTRRPLVQLEDSHTSDFIVGPVLVGRACRRLADTYFGGLSPELFDSEGMTEWIGGAVHREGHEFNEEVANRLCHLGFNAKAGVPMSLFGGGAALGDIDVLAWHQNDATVYAIECKRLLFDRTVGEIGKRLREFSAMQPTGSKRSPLRRHLDRLKHLRSNEEKLKAFVGKTKVCIVSCLVSDYVPMQYGGVAKSALDLVVDVDQLDKVFSRKAA